MREDKAVVTLSGGADSATMLYFAMTQCKEVHAISIDYGQRHVKELECAKELCKINNIPHTIIPFDLTIFGGSPLTDKNIDVPSQADQNQAATIVPYRNTFIAVIAAAYCKANDLNVIYMGPTYEDLANYPDCRPVFFDELQKALLLGGTIHDLEIRTPFISSRKEQIIRLGHHAFGVPYNHTYTCIVDDSRNMVNRAIGESCRPNKIRVDDELLAINESTNALVKTKVKKVIKKEASSFYLITLENKKELRLTGDHQIYTTKGWVQAQNLNLNSVLIHSSPLEKKRKFSAKIISETIQKKYGRVLSKSLKHRWELGLMPKTPKGTMPPKACREASSLRSKGKTYEEIYGEKAVEVRNKIRKSMRKWRKNNPNFNPMNDPITINKVVESNQKHMKACSERMKLHNPMCSPEIASRSIKAQQERPSGPEKILIGLIKNHKLPLTYCGDGSFWVKSGAKKNLNPDFKVNGAKKVLEVYMRNYPWRKKNWIEDRKTLFNAVGYEVLFIPMYTDRRNNEVEILKTINQFIHNGLKVTKIEKIKKKVTVYDYVCSPYHNFLLNWVVVHNCYKGGEEPCMVCDACRERLESFRFNGLRDPLVSEEKWNEYMSEFTKQ